jgi:tetratricopeptide (TPR) repeat protein
VVLWTRGLHALRALYREIGQRVGHHPLFEIYRAEIELWVGEYAQAESIFREILRRDRRTLWAWIGLGGALMLQGDLERAQKIWAEGVAVTNFEGPTLFALRGECARRQGDVESARRDLEHAVREKPQRLSAHINLALLDGEPARLADAIRRCEAFAPILMEELSGTPSERLEGVLRAMGGNRSSSPWLVCYQLWGHIWRKAG